MSASRNKRSIPKVPGKPPKASETKAASPDKPSTSPKSEEQQPYSVLPEINIKGIMKNSSGVDQVGSDCVFAITKATELFIETIIKKAYEMSKDKQNVDYKQLADAVQAHSSFEFLKDVIPQKMTYQQALKQIAKRQAESDEILFE